MDLGRIVGCPERSTVRSRKHKRIGAESEKRSRCSVGSVTRKRGILTVRILLPLGGLTNVSDRQKASSELGLRGESSLI